MKRFPVILGLAAILLAGLNQLNPVIDPKSGLNQADDTGLTPVLPNVSPLITKKDGGLVSASNISQPERPEEAPDEPVLPVTSSLSLSRDLIGKQSDLSKWKHGEHLSEFVDSVEKGDSDEVVGVYVPDVFALPVLKQPAEQTDYVSTQDGTVTQFSLPERYNVTGLLAHNYLSGKKFFELEVGQEVALVYGDQVTELFRINRIERFQALSPVSPYSDFIDLADPGQETISSSELFQEIYTTQSQLVFQTCIEANGNPSWGRIFIIADPVDLSARGVR